MDMFYNLPAYDQFEDELAAVPRWHGLWLDPEESQERQVGCTGASSQMSPQVALLCASWANSCVPHGPTVQPPKRSMHTVSWCAGADEGASSDNAAGGPPALVRSMLQTAHSSDTCSPPVCDYFPGHRSFVAVLQEVNLEANSQVLVLLCLAPLAAIEHVNPMACGRTVHSAAHCIVPLFMSSDPYWLSSWHFA